MAVVSVLSPVLTLWDLWIVSLPDLSSVLEFFQARILEGASCHFLLYHGNISDTYYTSVKKRIKRVTSSELFGNRKNDKGKSTKP